MSNLRSFELLQPEKYPVIQNSPCRIKNSPDLFHIHRFSLFDRRARRNLHILGPTAYITLPTFEDIWDNVYEISLLSPTVDYVPQSSINKTEGVV